MLGGIVLVLVGALAAAGVRDRRMLALGALCVTAPLEVYRGDVGPANLSVFRLALAGAATVVLLDGDLRATVRRVIGELWVWAAAAMVAVMVLSAAALSSNQRLAAVAAGQ